LARLPAGVHPAVDRASTLCCVGSGVLCCRVR
jgi:hypothetical protein